MVELGIHYEQDDAHTLDRPPVLTGRVQVVDEDLDLVMDTFDTEEEAEKAMAKMQVEFDRNDKIMAEYLEWEAACLARHEISQEELRVYLVNVVL